MRYQAIAGLTRGQLAELSARVAGVIGDVAAPGGRPPAIGLFRSVAMVVALLRHNLTQDVAGAFFGVSQRTVSRRWDLLRPAIGAALADCVPTPATSSATAPRWSTARRAHLGLDGHPGPVLRQGRVPGMNIQVAAALDGRIAAIGPAPCTAPATTRTPSPHPASRTCWPTLIPPPTSATPAWMASRSSRSGRRPAASSMIPRPLSTPRSARSAPPSSTQ